MKSDVEDGLPAHREGNLAVGEELTRVRLVDAYTLIHEVVHSKGCNCNLCATDCMLVDRTSPHKPEGLTRMRSGQQSRKCSGIASRRAPHQSSIRQHASLLRAHLE